MKRKAYLLFELLLVVFAIFALLYYDGSHRFYVALPCLVTALLFDKLAFKRADHDEDEDVQETDLLADAKKKGRIEALKVLLKNKNPLVLADAVNHLLQDLGVNVTLVPDSPSIDRILQVPGIDTKFGLVVVDDVSSLNQNWKKWDAVADFDFGIGGEQRLLIIASNGATDQDKTKSKFKKFPPDTQILLSAKHIVAMTTRTFGQIYKACKKKKVTPKKVFNLIQDHPGGVFPS
jgi:hypothetical protein